MKKILVVDDEIEMLELIKKYLYREGFEVLTTSSPDEAIRLMQFWAPDLIILDIMLPGADGFDICRKIRQNKSTPIIFISAKSDESDKVLGLGLGGDDYLTKPFSLNELIARVKALLRRCYHHECSSDKHNNIINHGSLEINLSSHEVFVSGKPISFTAKEFELLALMATNPNRIFSREELYERIWQDEAMGDSRTVIVHIKRIREKIEKNPREPEYLKTVWGVGYKFAK
ncbi:response regulator transcription factor [Desulfallas sp. Bu1-1]|uniref:response regulator transcription factor n=1 Tax=Desulfallas sp. Bu1-1 TaxID=2787620 RepID=UPI00189DECFC|nr:response regulator transcription factor [Desulfallas sp. Bu1-1]MBF7082570.1 response regulator transcription factor [Desulfallas sp. Bu1-1]